MKTFFWVCLASLIPGLLIRIPFGGGGILLSDLLFPAFAGIWWIHKLVVERKITTHRFFVAGSIFVAIAVVSWFLNSAELLAKEKILSFSYIVRFFSILTIGYAAADIIRDSLQTKKIRIEDWTQFLKPLWQILAVIIGIGFVQFYLIPDIGKFSTVGGFDPHQGRFLGTWMDPNFVAGLLTFLLPIMLGIVYQKQSGYKRLAILTAVCLLALFLTFSRSGYLAAALSLGCFFIFQDRKVILIGILLIALGLATNERAAKRVVALSGTLQSILLQDTDEIDPTANLRLESWSKSLTLWEKYPIMGIGYNTYRFKAADEGIVDESYFSAGGSDSTLLTILITTGTVGFIVFLWFYLGLIWRRLWQYRMTRNPVILGIWAGSMGLLVHSVFVNSLLFPHIFVVVLVFHGLAEDPDLQT